MQPVLPALKQSVFLIDLSCSVACSKLHNQTHPALEPTPKADKPPPPPQPNKGVPRAGTVAAAGYKGPFAALDSSKELQELFRKHPSLRSQLEDINSATLPPVEGCGFGQGGSRRGGKVEPWNSDRGLQKGVQALSKARDTSGEDGRCIREYSRLVLDILSGEEGAQAAEVIQKEMAEENTRIIEQLLNNER
ncbi:hypothetical protein LOCC1_G000349 [Lachnellula occidentalis]|uniref:Uncharacterized protein n=1 Tax=Lachnellula occidentalis TaxID=215460 RepID=A0A8H8UIH8_9HELO|nr:hypothetical protein LOCC1_G000349 [Lachnellula occidentalis]